MKIKCFANCVVSDSCECAHGCNRPAAHGFDSCCRTCISSGGKQHGPNCVRLSWVYPSWRCVSEICLFLKQDSIIPWASLPQVRWKCPINFTYFTPLEYCVRYFFLATSKWTKSSIWRSKNWKINQTYRKPDYHLLSKIDVLSGIRQNQLRMLKYAFHIMRNA